MSCLKSHSWRAIQLRSACSGLLPPEVRPGSGSGAGVLVLATDPLWPPGTLFLWMFWPSFNSALLTIPHERKKGVFNTYYALSVSAVTAISLSALTHPQGKISMVRRGAAPGPHLGLPRPHTRVHAPPPSPSPQVWVGEPCPLCHGAQGGAAACKTGTGT